MHAASHPSEPNYIATVGGDNFGLENDGNHSIPSRIATVVDLLDSKGISWAEYLEDYQGGSAPSQGASGGYVRKHDPLSSYDSVTQNQTRAANLKSFVDFEHDLSNKRLPQWAFFTPNIRNDGHDTGLDYAGRWLRGWLGPLLKNDYFTNNTLIVVTFDESGRSNAPNRVFTVLLGGAVPRSMHGTNSTMYFNHYSALSSVSVNWNLTSLGRWDCDANVFPPVAETANYTNTNITYGSMKWKKSYPGPLNSQAQFPPGDWPSPDTGARCAAGNGVLASIKAQWGNSTGTYNYTNVYPYDNGFRDTMGSVPAIGVKDVAGTPRVGSGAPTNANASGGATGGSPERMGIPGASWAGLVVGIGYLVLQ